MAVEKSNNDLNTTRALLQQLLNLAIPIFIGGAVQAGYQLINSFWVGRLGTAAVAVISVCMPINLLLISFGSGLSLAGSILTAQSHGARNHRQVERIAAQTFLAMSSFALMLSVAGYFLSPDILRLMRVSDEIFVDATHYLRVSFLGQLFLFAGAMYQAILRGIGESKAPLRIVVTGVIINAALDPLFIYGLGPLPAFGVGGAAYATLITQIVTAVAGVGLMLRPRFGLRFTVDALIPDWKLITQIFRLGFPVSIEQSMQALTVTLITIFAAKFGTLTLASYGLAFRVITFLIIYSFSISMAISILVGQSIGARNLEKVTRVTRVGTIFNFCSMALVGAVIFFLAEHVISFFVPHDASLIAHGATALRIFSLSFAFTAAQLALGGAFRGAGATFSAMVLTLFGAWAIQVPAAYVLSHFTSLGELGLWWATPIAAVVNAGVAALLFKSQRWMRI
ncbi:MAG: MATE family efflux transporter [Spongiibacteraceae bacterium]